MPARKKIAPTPEATDAMFAEWLAGIPAYRKARADLVAAVAKMPWWAQPGPTRLLSDGSMQGYSIWTPARQDVELPQGRIMRDIRLSAYDLERWCDHHPWPAELRRKHLERSLTQLAEREAAQHQEYVRAGVIEAQKVCEAHQRRFYGLRNKVSWMGPSPFRLAFEILVDIAEAADGEATIAQQSEATGQREFYRWTETLANVLSVLPPRMAETTARVLKTSAGPFRRVPIFVGPDERNPVHRFGLWRPAPAEDSTPPHEIAA